MWRQNSGKIASVGFASAMLFTFLGLQGCRDKQSHVLPVISATVSKPLEREVVEWNEFPARFESPQFANITARVGGIVEQTPFTEGSLIKAGDPLFIIDSRPYIADLKSKDAEIARADAVLAQAIARAKRYESLKGTRAISAEDFDEAKAALSQARANVAVAQAARDVAKLNLEWTRVLAPISGRVSKKYVTEGNLVTGGPSEGSTLTTITSVDPLFVSASIPEREFLDYQKIGQTIPSTQSEKLICRVRLENETEFSREGVLTFFDNRVDPATGTVEVRCTVSNADSKLVAGLFAKIRIPASKPYSTLLVPDTAVGTDQNSRFVLVAGPDNVVTRKSVILGATFGSFRGVVSGITKDDRMILNGLQQIRPGAKIEPKESTISEAPLTPFLASPSSIQTPPQPVAASSATPRQP